LEKTWVISILQETALHGKDETGEEMKENFKSKPKTKEEPKSKGKQDSKARIAARFGMSKLMNPLLKIPSLGLIVDPAVPEIYPFDSNPKIKACVQELIRNCKMDLDYYNSIFYYIASLGYGRNESKKEEEKSKYLCKTAEETFEDGWGNCASKTNLFIAMIDELTGVRKTSLQAFYAISENHYLHKDKDFLHAFPAVFIRGTDEEVPEEEENADFQFNKGKESWRNVLAKFKVAYSDDLHLLCGDTLFPHAELYHPILLTDDEARAAFYSNAHITFNDMKKEEAYLRKAISIAPTYWSSYYNLGLLLMEKNPGEAKRLFQKTLELHPSHIKAKEPLKSMK